MADPEYDVPVDPDADNNAHSAAIRLVGSDQRVLEVGCWSGHVTRHLADRGNSVIGVELDPEAARRAEAFAERVHVADIDRTPLSELETGPFDVILFGDVLEHLHDPRQVLEDAVGLLAPEGRFVISIPNVSHIDARMMLLQGNWEYQADGLLDRTHLRWFTRRSLRELLADVGFVATHVERIRTPFGSSNLPFEREAVSPELIGYATADPEAFTLQFVVEARRSGEDQLTDPPPPSWPQLGNADGADARVADLERERDALRAEVEAWHNSKLVRVTDPLRSLYARARRRFGR
jgi:SAM-dependent methyltransferase